MIFFTNGELNLWPDLPVPSQIRLGLPRGGNRRALDVHLGGQAHCTNAKAQKGSLQRRPRGHRQNEAGSM